MKFFNLVDNKLVCNSNLNHSVVINKILKTLSDKDSQILYDTQDTLHLFAGYSIGNFSEKDFFLFIKIDNDNLIKTNLAYHKTIEKIPSDRKSCPMMNIYMIHDENQNLTYHVEYHDFFDWTNREKITKEKFYSLHALKAFI